MGTAFICVACGQQYPETDTQPDVCRICRDGRQYVPLAGQRWTTSGEIAARHFGTWRLHEPGLYGFGITPKFAIGQRAMFVATDQGLILWDLVPFLDQATRHIVAALGGIRAIVISHPHYYSNLVEWSRAFGDVPIYLHEADGDWVTRPDPCIRHWSGDSFELVQGVTIVRIGGHFDGASVLHWAAGAGGAGVLLTGDSVQVGPDRRVSFMRSYPNMVPLDAASVERIAARLEPYGFERIYGAFFESVVSTDAQAVLRVSLNRYLSALTGDYRLPPNG